MKLEDLTVLGVTQEQAHTILSMHTKEVSKATGDSAGFKSENETLKAQLEERSRDIEDLKKSAGNAEELGKKLTELKSKYEADTTKLQEQIAARDYSEAVRTHIERSGVKFSSKAAERAFMADLKDKGFQLDGGSLLGFDEFLKAQKSTDPEAFAPEGNAQKPHFSTGASALPAQQVTRESFIKMPYQEQYKFKQENPALFDAMMKG